MNRCAKQELIERYMQVRANMIARYGKPFAGGSRDFLAHMLAEDGKANVDDGGDTQEITRICGLCNVVATLDHTGRITCADECTSIYAEIRNSSEVIWEAARVWDGASGVAS